MSGFVIQSNQGLGTKHKLCRVHTQTATCREICASSSSVAVSTLSVSCSTSSTHLDTYAAARESGLINRAAGHAQDPSDNLNGQLGHAQDCSRTSRLHGHAQRGAPMRHLHDAVLHRADTGTFRSDRTTILLHNGWLIHSRPSSRNLPRTLETHHPCRSRDSSRVSMLAWEGSAHTIG